MHYSLGLVLFQSLPMAKKSSVLHALSCKTLLSCMTSVHCGGRGLWQPLASQSGQGLPSAKVGIAVVVANTAMAARMSRIFFTVFSFAKGVRTVILCKLNRVEQSYRISYL